MKNEKVTLTLSPGILKWGKAKVKREERARLKAGTNDGPARRGRVTFSSLVEHALERVRAGK